jgi:hypothetical protein
VEATSQDAAAAAVAAATHPCDDDAVAGHAGQAASVAEGQLMVGSTGCMSCLLRSEVVIFALYGITSRVGADKL